MMERFGLDPESRAMVLDVVDKLKARLLTRERILEYDRKEVFPEEVIREMLGPDIGLQLLFIPEEYGGMGGGARDCCALTRKMAGVCLGIATAFFAIQLGADPILVGGTQAQKERWLEAIAEGGALVAYAVTEPGAGSNLAALKTKAEPVLDESGSISGYRITGNKQFISTGGYADFLTVLADTPDGPSFFIVEKGTPGFVPGKAEEKHGIRASNTAALRFDDVFVPADRLVGETPGQGLKQANAVFGYTRLMVAAMALGAAEAALAIVVPYAKDRIQFGTPLSEKQGYTHKLVVPHAVRLSAAEAFIDEVALRIDAGEQDLQVEGSIAKLFATEVANRAADDAMQALGGYGYTVEFGVEKIKRDIKITCIYEGTSEIQQNIISTFRWKKTWKTKGRFYLDMADEMAQWAEKYADVGAAMVSQCARYLNRIILLAHERRWTRSQYTMFLLADMMTQVEVAVARVRKTVQAIEAASDAQEKEKVFSRIFSVQSAECILTNGLKVLLGTEMCEAATQLAGDMSRDLSCGANLLINDMDAAASFIFGRAS
ncbi:acyl-CoA dehydrogenase family protein [Desulfatirhabdium butyrativorans]|uniref:acyl-CoA dehydrogenase family protein n=1 Tax=Desulfatirhabdium butyrativorans TaxID=340467 RepID=UPI000428E3DA|nr:acyl-CoA dehydrogenase family protein [Desulfatirhabdium butyrativorans]